ncbi:hypothetical protein FOZ63_009880, partial [Perkinsus olseni]
MGGYRRGESSDDRRSYYSSDYDEFGRDRRSDRYGGGRREDDGEYRRGRGREPDREWLEKRMKDRWSSCSSREIAEMILAEDRTCARSKPGPLRS